MSKYTKYKLYQKYETRGSQEAIPCYPNVFSIDGDGTMPLVIVEENSRDCGYTGETQPIYRWYTLPIDTYYYCDACQDAQYKWVNLPISQDWECVGTTKYYKQKKQVSVDGGSTWTDVTPPQYQRGSVYEYNSQSCGYRTRTSSGSPYCEGYDKYVDVYNQVSSDGGNTWQTTATTPTMVEHNSAYCGYVPLSTKLRASYINGTSYSADCDSNTTLTSGDTRPNGYIYTAMTSVEIGNCITSIGQLAFDGCRSLTSCTIGSGVTSIGYRAFFLCTSLTSVTIPDSVTSIGQHAFYGCTSLTSIDIPNSVISIGANTFANCSGLTSIVIPNTVTTIGGSAFSSCSGLTSITVNATTPPTLGTNVFYNTNDSPIYVPCESVQAYKTASRWSDYASRIRGIPPCDEPTPSEDQYLTFVARESGTFSFGRTIRHHSIQYSLDSGISWTTLASDTNSPTVQSGNKIMWKSNITPETDIGIGIFSSTGSFDVEGNPMSLLYGDNFRGQTSLAGTEEAFFLLFSGCTGLTSAENLVLPATTLGKECYNAMFMNCTSLTKAPKVLPATTLAIACYSMMFYGCTSLTTAPVLQASTLVGLCYDYMFKGCTNLNYVKCLATDISADSCTRGWLNNVSSSGTFVKASSATWERGADGIPTNWTIQNA